MKIHYRVLLLLLCAWGLHGCQAYVASQLPNEGIRPPAYQVAVEPGVAMNTSDGIALVADIYHPKTAARAPTILVRIPFSKSFKNTLMAQGIGNYWASRGYHVVIQGTRGRYESGGSFYPLANERRDGIETLQWLSRQPWFDGRLGMWGGSAFGHTQWAVADQDAPGPGAYAIQIASSDFYGMFYPGGAFSLESALFWAMRSRGTEDVDVHLKSLERGFEGFPLLEADSRAIADISFFNDWASHRTRDSYWEKVDGRDRAQNLKAPVLLMAGWLDPFLPTQLKDFVAARRSTNKRVAEQSRLIIGPWLHADPIRFPDGTEVEPYRRSSLGPSIPWFDQQLMGHAMDPSLAAPVRLYVMGENVWRDEQEWPLARAKITPMYFSSEGKANSSKGNGRLGLEMPPAGLLPDTYQYDPREPVPSRGGAMLGPRAGIFAQEEVESRQDVLVYTTDPLTEAMEITGPVQAVLYVGTSAPNTDFTVKLVDVHPDGKAYNVSDGILRRDYALQSVPHEIVLDLWPTSMLFKKGHRIRIEVASSNYPRYDRNPNTGRDIPTETRTEVARQTVYHDAAYPSRIMLPVIPRGSKPE